MLPFQGKQFLWPGTHSAVICQFQAPFEVIRCDVQDPLKLLQGERIDLEFFPMDFVPLLESDDVDRLVSYVRQNIIC